MQSNKIIKYQPKKLNIIIMNNPMYVYYTQLIVSYTYYNFYLNRIKSKFVKPQEL